MKRDRYFFSAASFVLLAFLLIGFRKFYLHGVESDDTPIPPAIKALVIVHGLALSAWVVLFFVQSVLIASRNRRLHMKLGWVAAAVALAIAVSGPITAVAAVRVRPGEQLFGMTYRQFLLPMFIEIIAFTVFIGLGLLNRNRPAIHRSMMVLATLSVISGATSRTEFLYPIFGTDGWFGLFGPVLVLGAAILLVRTILARSLDWWYAAGYVALGGAYILAMNLAVGGPWSQLALQIARG
jgi:hypothetical protein